MTLLGNAQTLLSVLITLIVLCLFNDRSNFLRTLGRLVTNELVNKTLFDKTLDAAFKFDNYKEVSDETEEVEFGRYYYIQKAMSQLRNDVINYHAKKKGAGLIELHLLLLSIWVIVCDSFVPLIPATKFYFVLLTMCSLIYTSSLWYRFYTLDDSTYPKIRKSYPASSLQTFLSYILIGILTLIIFFIPAHPYCLMCLQILLFVGWMIFKGEWKRLNFSYILALRYGCIIIFYPLVLSLCVGLMLQNDALYKWVVLYQSIHLETLLSRWCDNFSYAYSRIDVGLPFTLYVALYGLIIPLGMMYSLSKRHIKFKIQEIENLKAKESLQIEQKKNRLILRKSLRRIKNKPLISVVVPAFNVEQYIRDMAFSIQCQTWDKWEMIVVDDCSTDSTVQIVEELSSNDERIRLIKRTANSGGPRLPRLDGVLAAKGSLICAVDADDSVEDDYLLKLLCRKSETSSQVVLGRMVLCDSKMNPNGRSIPIETYDMSFVCDGREAVRRNLGHWEMAMAGMLIDASLYKAYAEDFYKKGLNISFEDELDHRRLLITCKKVALANAAYFYRQQPQSIMHRISVKRFNELTAAQLNYDFTLDNFSEEKEVVNRVLSEYMEKVYRCRLLYLNHRSEFNNEDALLIQNKIKDSYTYASQCPESVLSWKMRMLRRSYSQFQVITFVISLILRLKFKR
jgi:glycosyltransferase involved in cell wall biosynthesis